LRPASRLEGSRLEQVDYDLHGVVGIRLIDPRPGDARAVDRQLGPLRRPLEREPDLVVRFVDDLRLTKPLHYLGLDEAAFTEDEFLVLHSKHSARARVKIPLERVGGRCEIVCESGLPAVPLLIPILNLTALAHGVAPLHASAFLYDGAGVLVTGWSKGGKTEALLAFMAQGAQYLGDEWIYVSGDSSRMYGIPQPIRLWDWHLKQSRRYREQLEWGDRARLGALEAVLALGRGLTGGRRARSAPGRALQRVLALMKRQAHVDVDPERLFGPCRTLEGRIDRVFLIGSSADPRIEVEPIDGAEVVERMVHSVRYELERFMSYYLMFKFAFPARTNPWIDSAEEHLSRTLHRALASRPSYVVRHPYPMSIAGLFDAMSPFVSGPRAVTDPGDVASRCE
jgi:hypothetical protein